MASVLFQYLNGPFSVDIVGKSTTFEFEYFEFMIHFGLSLSTSVSITGSKEACV